MDRPLEPAPETLALIEKVNARPREYCDASECKAMTAKIAALEAREKALVSALLALDACYCEASDEMSRAQRDHHRKVLIEVRALMEQQP